MNSRLSIIVPCYNEEDALPHFIEEMEKVVTRLSQMACDAEVLLIDDGSVDMTWPQIVEWAQANSKVRGVSLSRNFGHQGALSCGYELVTGDAVVTIDADLQDPPETIYDMVAEWRRGADIVLAVRKNREAETGLKLFTAWLYYRTLHALGLRFIEKDCGDFRLMNRRSVDALNGMRERNRMLRAMVGWIGFKVERIYYDRKARIAGKTKYPFLKMLRLAMDGIVSFSAIPLRLCYLLSLLGMLVVFAYLGVAVYEHLSNGAPLVPGWTSLIIINTLFGATILLCLGLIGEYLYRIYGEVKGRPLFMVRADTRTDNRDRE